MFTVLRRCLYIHLPMSIICTRYFREIGVAFDWAGTAESWQGVSTSKNTLGQIAMLGVLYFFWEVRRNWPKYGIRNLHVIYLLMALYLLKGGPGSVSMTSISVCAIAVVIFLRIQALRYRLASVRGFVLTAFGLIATLGTFVVVHSVAMFSADSIFGKMITLFGRDITLTDRTFIWHDVYGAAASNPLFGVGFGGFWIGRMSNIPWNAQMTWVLGQAHSGYVDTYLQLGVVGVVLLLCVFFTTLPRLLDSLTDDFDLGCFRITMFLTILFINITESVYLRGDHHLWLIFQVVLWAIPPDGTGIDKHRSEYEVSRAPNAPDDSATPSEPLQSSLASI
jgi:O-antigen ligase